MYLRIIGFFSALFFLLVGFAPIQSGFVPNALAASHNDTRGEVVVLQKNQTVNHNYFTAGHDITVSGTVNGDAYIAGGNVLVDGTINGDLLVAGGNVIIRGKVTQNIRVIGGTIQIAGNVGRNVSAAGGTVTIETPAVVKGSFVSAGGNVSVLAPVGETVDVAGSTLVIGNAVRGDVQAAVSQLTLTSASSVLGNVSYWSDTKADMQAGSQVNGSIHHFLSPGYRQTDKKHFQSAIIVGKLLSFLIYTLLGLFFVFFFSHFTTNVSNIIRTRTWASFGWGILMTLFSPFLIVLLFVTVLGIPFAVIVICWFILAIFVSKVFIAFALGGVVSKYAKTVMHPAGIYILGLLLWEILKFIPFIGGLLSLFALFVGLGSLFLEKKRLYQVLRKEKYL